MKIEKVTAWRVEDKDVVYVRLAKVSDDNFNIWYEGISDGFALVREGRANQLEAAFKEIQNACQVK